MANDDAFNLASAFELRRLAPSRPIRTHRVGERIEPPANALRTPAEASAPQPQPQGEGGDSGQAS